MVQFYFGQVVAMRTQGDLNGDNFVDILDWLEVQLHFGDYLETIPEPTSLVVFGGCCGLGLLFARRKRRKSTISNS